ncbi:MAG: hypothetical protein ABIK68_13505 [bacterium]
MASTKVQPHLFRLLLIGTFLGCLTFTGNYPLRAAAQPPIHPDVEFVEFWSNYESVFLFHPQLVQQIFLGIVDLKGNRQVATSHVIKEVLACTFGSNSLSESRLDQLKLAYRKQQVSSNYTVAVNITEMTGHPLKSDKNQYVLTIRWQPVVFEPPVLSVEAFYRYLGVASQSEYYSGKKGVDRIQINPLFQSRVSVRTSKATAINLLKIYRNPPTDYKDAFIFQLDKTEMNQVYNSANFDLHFKAVKVKINHSLFEPTKELML